LDVNRQHLIEVNVCWGDVLMASRGVPGEVETVTVDEKSKTRRLHNPRTSDRRRRRM